MFDTGHLNQAQRDAALHGDGPLLVVAGAGTGKTLTLACRVASLVERGIPPERILLLTFTRRAAREMLTRAERMTARDVAGKVWGGTFHAVANRLLRHLGRPVGVRPDFTVLDQGDAADLLGLIREEEGLSASRRRFPRKETLAAIYSRTVNAGTPLAEVLRADFPWCAEQAEGIREVFLRYTGRKREGNVLDFDDLLLYWDALAAEPAEGPRMEAMFDHVLVDEYQDTNATQASVLRRLRAGNRNLTAVGDDAQSIYSFRNATNRNILEFDRDFPGTTVVKLEQNYRSTQPLLDASNAVIALSSKRHRKTLWTARTGRRPPVLLTCRDDADQAEAVCRRLLEHREEGTLLRDQAVLFRAAHHSDRLEIELTHRNIPFVKYGGLRFLEAAHVKDVLAILRILENPLDEVSWFRTLQLCEGVGPAVARRLIAQLGVRGAAVGGGEAGSPLHRLLSSVPEGAPPPARAELEALRRALADCTAGDAGGAGPAAQIDRLRVFLEPVFLRAYSNPRERLHDVEQLAVIAATSASRGRFLADLTLDPPTSTGDLAGPPLLDEDYVTLSTIHSAKGCEWSAVHVIHAADGMIPSDMATGDTEEMEEERRLFYVALTRAKDALYVYFPLRYYRRPFGLEDRHSYGQLTRFLPPSARDRFDRQATPASDDAVTLPAEAHMGAGRGDPVEALVQRLWAV